MMKIFSFAILFVSSFSTEAYLSPIKNGIVSNAFAVVSPQQPQLQSAFLIRSNNNSSNKKESVLKMSSMESDFGTAMPEKPKQTLLEKLNESATNFIVTLESRLANGVEAPPELQQLRSARDSSDTTEKELVKLIYELMIEQGMCYDEDAETGKLSPTDFDIPNNLEVPEVKQEFSHLYKYGMGLVQQNLMDVDTCKSIVETRLIKRTGLTPQKFDEWLGY